MPSKKHKPLINDLAVHSRFVFHGFYKLSQKIHGTFTSGLLRSLIIFAVSLVTLVAQKNISAFFLISVLYHCLPRLQRKVYLEKLVDFRMD